MVKMRRTPTGKQAAALQDPLRHSVTVCVDIAKSGAVTAVVGTMDLASRRYRFVRLADRNAGPPDKYQVVTALQSAVNEMLDDAIKAPF